MRLHRVLRRNVSVFCASLAFATSGLHADIIATDNNVPSIMDVGGTEDDPATYILGLAGAISRDVGNTGAYVGLSSSYNFLVVASGSTLTSKGGIVGSGSASQYNMVALTGSGTSWAAGDRIDVGKDGSNNHLSVEEGAHITVGKTYVGLTGTAHHNTLNILGAGSSMTVSSSTGITLGSYGSNNILRVGYGGTLTTGMAYIGFNAGANDNEAIVYGRGSTWSLKQLSIASYFDGTGNALTIEDGGLVRVSGYYSLNSAVAINSSDNNFLNLNDGFLAIEGDATHIIADLIDDGAFRFWDGSTWQIAGVDDLLFGYFADDADAFAFSGYADLGGYTIVTNVAGTAIPEPSTYAALAGCAMLGLAIARRYQRGRRCLSRSNTH